MDDVKRTDETDANDDGQAGVSTGAKSWHKSGAPKALKAMLLVIAGDLECLQEMRRAEATSRGYAVEVFYQKPPAYAETAKRIELIRNHYAKGFIDVEDEE